MPLYEYLCDSCGNRFELRQKFSDKPAEVCPECGGKDFREEKSIEVGNIFKNKDKYTKAFELKVKNDEGVEVIVLTGCYGIGLQRLLGAVVEVHNDEKGIIWPEAVAPFQIHLLSLNKNAEAEKLYDELIEKGVEVLYDDREASAGEKFADADLIGIPYQMIISEKTLKDNKVEIKNRKNGEKSFVKFSATEIIAILNRIFK